MKRYLFCAVLAAFCLGGAAASAAPDKRVVILAGSGGEPEFVAQFAGQAERLRAVLKERFGYRDEEIHVLVEAAADSAGRFEENTAAAVRARFADLGKRLSQKDALLVFMLGHGTFDEWAKLNIAGPDLRDIDYAGLIDRIPAGRVLFVNMGSASGPFLEKLSREGRIVVTATRNGLERNVTRFPEHFLSALEQDNAADLDKDGNLSVAEAFIFTRDNLVSEYDEKKQLRTEHPLLDDNGDGEGTETPDLLSGDGVVASRFVFKQERAAQVAGSDSAAAATEISPRKKAILARVRKLQERKATMPEQEYYAAFEKLMLELAQLNKAASPEQN